MAVGCNEFNTSLIERFNGTMREKLAALTRKCRHAAHRLEALETGMYVLGCTYNFCFAHHKLSRPKHFGFACSPAMAAGLTAHLGTVQKVFVYKIAPAPWVAPKAVRRLRKHGGAEPMIPKWPRGRPRKLA